MDLGSGRPRMLRQWSSPDGYATLPGDNCADDPDKQNPGICGCVTQADDDNDGTDLRMDVPTIVEKLPGAVRMRRCRYRYG